MPGFSNELKVGLFAIVALGAVAWGILRVDDVPDGQTGERWHVNATFPSVQGAFVTTPVRIAGIRVGSVEAIELVGGQARVTIGFLPDVAIPEDSTVNFVGEGLLGDKAIVVSLGRSTVMLKDGDTLRVGEPPADVQKVIDNVHRITEDVLTITGQDSQYRAELLATLQAVRELTVRLNDIAGENDVRIAQIAENLLMVSESLRRVVDKTGSDVESEMAAIRAATDTLDRTLREVESLAKGINAGEGTVGRLMKDGSTVDKVNDTIDKVGVTVDNVNETVTDVQGLVGSVSALQTQVYLRGDYYVGTEPTEDGLEENPVAGGSRTTLGVRLMPAQDHWYEVEFTSSPLGNIQMEDHYYPDSGTSYREVVVRPTYRMSFQMAKRFHSLAFRFGMKESTGGIGVDWFALRDRLQLSADLYDFAYASWPVLDGTPNLQLNARVEPFRHLYLEGGLDNLIFNSRYGFVTGYVGAGFSFTDDDLKYILAVAPVKP